MLLALFWAYFSIAAALVNWSLISLVDLVAFLVIQFNLPRRGEFYAACAALLYFPSVF